MVGLIRNTAFNRFADQHHDRRSVTIARLELHSMNGLNVATFDGVEIDFGIGRKFL